MDGNEYFDVKRGEECGEGEVVESLCGLRGRGENFPSGGYDI